MYPFYTFTSSNNKQMETYITEYWVRQGENEAYVKVEYYYTTYEPEVNGYKTAIEYWSFSHGDEGDWLTDELVEEQFEP